MKYQVTKNLAGAYSVKFNCPGCGVKLSEALRRAGQHDTCPDCSCQFEIPGVKELETYQAKQQQLEEEKAQKRAEKEAEKERARKEKEQEREKAEEVERLKAAATRRQQSETAPAPAPVPQTVPVHAVKTRVSAGMITSGVLLATGSFLPFAAAGFTFVASVEAENIMHQIYYSLQFYGAAGCGCILLVGSCLSFGLSTK